MARKRFISLATDDCFLSMDTSQPVPFHIIRPLINESAIQMDISSNEQQDAAEFYLQLLVPFFRESCLTNEIEVSKSVMCLNCNNNSVIENSTSGTLTVAVRPLSLDNCVRHCFDDEIVRSKFKGFSFVPNKCKCFLFLFTFFILSNFSKNWLSNY